MADIIIYSAGLCYMSVCAANTMGKEEIAKEANAQNPTGISSRWRVASEPFKTGQTNPCQCEDHADRQHWLLSC